MKGSQAGLLAAAELVFDPQLPADPSQTQACWSEVRRGKVWTYRVRASGALPDWVAFPGLRQVVEVEREVYDKKTRRLTQRRSYALTSLDWEAQRLGWLVRARWGIENHDFLVRDVTFGGPLPCTGPGSDRSGPPPGVFHQLLAGVGPIQPDRRS